MQAYSRSRSIGEEIKKYRYSLVWRVDDRQEQEHSRSLYWFGFFGIKRRDLGNHWDSGRKIALSG